MDCYFADRATFPNVKWVRKSFPVWPLRALFILCSHIHKQQGLPVFREVSNSEELEDFEGALNILVFEPVVWLHR